MFVISHLFSIINISLSSVVDHAVTTVVNSLRYVLNMFSGGRVWLQEAGLPSGMDWKTCSNVFCSSIMQRRPNPTTGVLLEGTK